MHPSGVRTKKTAGGLVADEPLWLRVLLIAAAYSVIGLLILVPVVYVFVQAFAEGWQGYVKNLWHDPDTRHSIFLTLTVAQIGRAHV